MIGMDIATLLKAHRANPNITLPEFLALAQKQGFTVEGLSSDEATRALHAEFASTQGLLKGAGEIE